MNLNNAIAPPTKPASKDRWQGWLLGLGFAVATVSTLLISDVAHAASEKLPEKSYTMAPHAPERQTAQEAFAKTEAA